MIACAVTRAKVRAWGVRELRRRAEQQRKDARATRDAGLRQLRLADASRLDELADLLDAQQDVAAQRNVRFWDTAVREQIPSLVWVMLLGGTITPAGEVEYRKQCTAANRSRAR